MVNLYRQCVLGIAGLAPLERLLRRSGFRFGVGRFVAGEDLDSAMAALDALNADGLYGLLDVLGEFVDTPEGVNEMVEQVLQTLDRLGQRGRGGYMSVKPTQLGLGLSEPLALDNASRIAEKAASVGAHVCLDMENHPYVDGTIGLFRQLQQRGLTNVSTVLQSCLHRSEADLATLAADFPGAQIRIVKGAYREPTAVATHDTATVSARYLSMVQTALRADMRVNIATHDETLIRAVQEQLLASQPGTDNHEFQLLYGIKPRLQARLRDEGQAVRIYVPYGRDWYGYFSRRLAERPANLGVVVRGLFS